MTSQSYLEYWQKNGLQTITPPDNPTPEGFDVYKVLRGICGGPVLEVGCGTGRIAKGFLPQEYIGVDINADALAKARAELPDYDFRLIEIGEYLPMAETVLFYTVCLHIPDDLIERHLKEAAHVSNRVVIAEIMNRKHRDNRDKSAAYDISNHRTLQDYIDIMARFGFRLVQSLNFDYAHYDGEVITFAVFEP